MSNFAETSFIEELLRGRVYEAREKAAEFFPNELTEFQETLQTANSIIGDEIVKRFREQMKATKEMKATE